jgi:hypothetical protein
MIDMDAGISGTTKIDEPLGMRHLFGLITQNKIGAVACQDEDRLFRDVTQIQVNIFIEACRVHQVLVITPTMVYNFSHEQLGTFHARQFRFKSETAAEYINTVIRGKLLSARYNLHFNGQWAGGPIPVGFMVDMRKTLSDGTRNEKWKRFEIFEPYAAVVREYFRLYVAYSGNACKTLRQIQQKGPHFPDPKTCLPPEGFKVHYKIKQNTFGWCPKSLQSLIYMYMNAAYIGHWVVNNAVIRLKNHPALIDETTFYRAFNCLSRVTLDGSSNQHYRRRNSNARISEDELRPHDRPLLSGLIYSDWEEKLKQVGTHWIEAKQGFHYVFNAYDGLSTPLWHKKASYLDVAVANVLFSKLRNTFDYATWEEAVEEHTKDLEEQRRLKTAHLHQLKNVMENLVMSLASLSTPQMVVAVERKYQDAQAEHDRLTKELDSILAAMADMERIKTIRDSYSQALDDWDAMNSDDKREIMHLFIDKIVAMKTDKGVVDITIHWNDGSTDCLQLPRVTSSGTVWLPQEMDLLINMVKAGATQVEIAQTFPDRKWKSIYFKYTSVTKESLDLRQDHPIKKHESYNEYIQRIGWLNIISVGGS